jgi:hypothetical protein
MSVSSVQCSAFRGSVQRRIVVPELSYKISLDDFGGFAKNSEFVRPVPDQVRDDGSGIQNKLELLDSGLRRKDALKKFWLFTT